MRVVAQRRNYCRLEQVIAQRVHRVADRLVAVGVGLTNGSGHIAAAGGLDCARRFAVRWRFGATRNRRQSVGIVRRARSPRNTANRLRNSSGCVPAGRDTVNRAERATCRVDVLVRLVAGFARGPRDRRCAPGVDDGGVGRAAAASADSQPVGGPMQQNAIPGIAAASHSIRTAITAATETYAPVADVL